MEDRREVRKISPRPVRDDVLRAVAMGPHHTGVHHAHAPEHEGAPQQADDDGSAWVQLIPFAANSLGPITVAMAATTSSHW